MKSLSAIHTWARGVIYGSLSFICGLVLGGGFLIRLSFVVLQDRPYPLFIPAAGNLFLLFIFFSFDIAYDRRSEVFRAIRDP